jgi:hypothetical protein
VQENGEKARMINAEILLPGHTEKTVQCLYVRSEEEVITKQLKATGRTPYYFTGLQELEL